MRACTRVCACVRVCARARVYVNLCTRPRASMRTAVRESRAYACIYDTVSIILRIRLQNIIFYVTLELYNWYEQMM